MHYDFDKIIDRRNTGSIKWDVPEIDLPMWVADMDFETAPAVKEALKERVDHGIFGYTTVPESWYEAYQNWWERRHHFRPAREHLLFCNGVIPAIDTAIRDLTEPGDQVVILTPTNNHFFISITDNNRLRVECYVTCEDGSYTLNKDDFAAKAADPKTKLLLLSNPQNPTGTIWDADTLAWIGQTCKDNDVLVIADDIHCDLTDPGYDYVPFASVSETCADNSITCIAPTKTFNIAGIQTAAVVISNRELRRKMRKGIEVYGASMPNAFAIEAAIAAFNHGEPWLDNLRQYLADNKKYVHDYLAEHLPQVKAVSSHATYLMWLDFSQMTEDGTALNRYIRSTTGLFMMHGQEYGSNGKAFTRLNIACPRKTLEDGLDRLTRAIKAYTAPVKGVVFDMDGLLLDTEKLVQRVWTEVGTRFGYPDMGEQIYHTLGFNRQRRKAYFESVYGPEWPDADIVAACGVRFTEIVQTEGIPVKKGAKELLQHLKDKGIRIGLATSTSEEHAREELEGTGLWDFFDGRIFGNMITQSKPAPEIYEKACKAIGVDPAEAIALEDAPSGIRSAFAAGLRVIMIPDMVQPTEEVRALTFDVRESLLEVIELVDTNCSR
jgi:cystathionine beta-lyase